jgi:hypothetical protein
VVKAKSDFLWYKAGQTIKEEDLVHVPIWASEGLVEQEAKKAVVVEEETSSLKDRIQDVVEDLMDDGILNNSHKKGKKKGKK